MIVSRMELLHLCDVPTLSADDGLSCSNACHLCEYCADVPVVQCCLTLLEAVVSYSLLPRAALPTFVAALCRTVNLEQYCQHSWKVPSTTHIALIAILCDLDPSLCSYFDLDVVLPDACTTSSRSSLRYYPTYAAGKYEFILECCR